MAARVPELRLGIHLGNFSVDGAGAWDRLVGTAVAADQAGIDAVIVSDHVVFGERLDEYARPEVGGVRGGRQPTGPDGHWLEPVTLLAYLAARTSRVRLTTHVLLAALRRPVVLAKSLATLDVLSAGRLDIGVGVGWQREEYEAAGLDFGDRGHLLDTTLEICQLLWRERVATYRAGEVVADGIHQMPKPAQPGGVPLWISGTLNQSVVERLARFGSGWIPWGDDAAELPAAIGRMRELVAGRGRDPSEIRVVARVPTSEAGRAADIAALAPLVAAGATDFVARIVPATGEEVETFGAWATEFRRLHG